MARRILRRGRVIVPYRAQGASALAGRACNRSCAKSERDAVARRCRSQNKGGGSRAGGRASAKMNGEALSRLPAPSLPRRSEQEVAGVQLSGEVVQLDLEVRGQVVVDVAFDNGVSGAIRKETELTGARERIGSDE